MGKAMSSVEKCQEYSGQVAEKSYCAGAASATPMAALPCRLFSVSDHALTTHACKGVRAILVTS